MGLRQPPRYGPHLGADVGDGDDLPERAAGHRAEAEQAGMGLAVRPDQAALAVDVEAEPVGVGAGMAGRDQPAQQRLGRARQVALRPGAVDDAARGQGPGLVGVAGAPLDLDMVPPVVEGGGLAGDDLEPPARLHLGHLGGDGGGEAVAVDVPPWPQVAHEAGALLDRRAEPQALRERPQLVDRGAPADHRGPVADLAEQRRRPGGRLLVAVPRRPRRDMCAGQQAPPAHRDDAPAEPCRVEAQRHVDHGQAGADQQHGVGIGQPFDHLRVPRVVGVEVGREGIGVEARRSMRRQVADRDDDRVEGLGRTALEVEGDAVLGDVRAADAVVDEGEALTGAGGGALEELAEVLAVHLALGEVAAAADAPGGAPLGEVLRPVAERAHVAGADVEQVRRVRRGIGSAAPEHRTALDQRRLRPGMAQDVDGQQATGEARPDDRDGLVDQRLSGPCSRCGRTWRANRSASAA